MGNVSSELTPSRMRRPEAASPDGDAADGTRRLLAAIRDSATVGAGRDGSEQPLSLRGIDLSTPAVQYLLAGDGAPPWWDAQRRVVDLKGANLQGADLRYSTLDGVDLSGAILRDARLTEASMRGTILDQAVLAGADLAGARLDGAALGEANLHGAFLEEVNLTNASLRFARLDDAVLEGAILQGADLWGAVLERAALNNSNLQDALLIEVRAGGVDLTGSTLTRCNLQKADLRAARLRGVDLQGAVVAGADLSFADLGNARLEGVVLAESTIDHVSLGGAWLDKTRLRREQLGGSVGEELRGDYSSAARAYLDLEQNFLQLGDPEAASWAYLRKRRMQKQQAGKEAQAALQARRWPRAAAAFSRFTGDQIVEWVCDYGESIGRVLVSIIVLSAMFTVIYAATGSVIRVGGGHVGIFDFAIFTLLAMTSQVPPGLEVRNEQVLLLTGTQTLLSVFLVGLLGFVAGNRIRR